MALGHTRTMDVTFSKRSNLIPLVDGCKGSVSYWFLVGNKGMNWELEMH